MSPGQLRGEPLDHRSDLFSLGLVLYEMATGRQAFSGATPGLLFDAILNATPAPLGAIAPNVSPELARIIDKALEKDRNLRGVSRGPSRQQVGFGGTAVRPRLLAQQRWPYCW